MKPELPTYEQNADEYAFVNALYDRYRVIIFDIASNILHNEHDAEETVSAVMMNIAKNIAEFAISDEDSIKNKIVAYTKNAAINIYRQNRRRRNAESAQLTADIEDGENKPDDITLQKEISETVSGAISKLPEKYRNVINLIYIEGYSYKETAEILGITENAVGVLLTRAKKKLKNIGGDMLYDLYQSL